MAHHVLLNPEAPARQRRWGVRDDHPLTRAYELKHPSRSVEYQIEREIYARRQTLVKKYPEVFIDFSDKIRFFAVASDEGLARETPGNFELGSSDEREYRALLLGKLAHLEDLVADIPAKVGMIGHNNPPEAVDDSSRQELANLSVILAEVKGELQKRNPEPHLILPKYEAAQSIKGRLTKAISKKLDLATDEFSKSFGHELGKSLGRLVFWGPLIGSLASFLFWLKGWLSALVTL